MALVVSLCTCPPYSENYGCGYIYMCVIVHDQILMDIAYCS